MPSWTREAPRLPDAGLVGIFSWTIDGRIIDANDTLLQMLGYTREDLASGRIDGTQLLPPERYVAGRHAPIEKELLRTDGARIPVVIASALQEGSSTEGVSFVLDLTEQKRALEKASEPAPEIATIFESMTDAFLALDSDWKFTYVNAEAERVLFRTRAELIGRNIWEAFPEALASLSYTEYHRAMNDRVAVSFTEFYPPLGTWFEAHAYPSVNNDGSPRGLSVYFRNINERKKAEEDREAVQAALRGADERLRLALASGGLGTWDADLTARTLTFSEEVPPLYGRPRAAVTIPILEWIGWLHPDDRERIPRAFAAALRGEADPGIQFRTLWPDGVTSRWVATRALLLRDADGTPVHAVGYTRDITHEKERAAEQETLLQRQRLFMRDLVSSLTEGKFQLCLTESDLPTPQPRVSATVPLASATLRVLRDQVHIIATDTGLSDERRADLVIAVGEVSLNAVVHAGGGEGWVCADKDRRTVQVWIADSGTGISDEALPHVLERGVSSAGTLGHGFWLVLRTCDRIYLLTGPHGTTVVLEQDHTSDALFGLP